jgi:hypothetical protein
MLWIIVVVSTGLSILLSLAMVLLLRRARVIRGRGTGGAVHTAAVSPGSLAARGYPVRRPAMRTRTALLVCLLLLADVLVTGGVAAYFQRENIRQTELLQAEGIVTRATVVGLDVEEDDEGDETYYVTYTFVSRPDRPEEREVTRRESVSYAVYSRLEQGGRIEVIYAPSEPKVARVTADYVPGRVDYTPAVIGAAVGLPSLIALLWLFTRYRRVARLDEEGMTATAEVLGMYEDSGGDSTSYYIAYQLPGGQPFRQSVGASVYRRLQVGGQVTVRYLPDDPSVFRLEGA